MDPQSQDVLFSISSSNASGFITTGTVNFVTSVTSVTFRTASSVYDASSHGFRSGIILAGVLF